MSTECDGGFSSGYVLLSFQILTPSSRQLPLTTPLELRSRLPCVQTRENPPYKGGCPKIGLDRRGGMNQNTPNPGVALRWPHPCSLPIEWGSRGCPSNANLRPRMVLDIQVWLPARDGDGMCCHPSNGVMIKSRGERKTKALEGTEEYPTDSEQHQAEKPEGTVRDWVIINYSFENVELLKNMLTCTCSNNRTSILFKILFLFSANFLMAPRKWRYFPMKLNF